MNRLDKIEESLVWAATATQYPAYSLESIQKPRYRAAAGLLGLERRMPQNISCNSCQSPS